MVFPYVTADAFERELTLTANRLGVSDSQWDTLVDDVLESESERVETADYAGETWRDVESTDDVPGIVREAVVRLARARLYAVESDGLQSENTGDSASYDYRSLAEIRSEVMADLQAADLSRDDGDGGPDGFRVSLL
jgi:hypothetical protein